MKLIKHILTASAVFPAGRVRLDGHGSAPVPAQPVSILATAQAIADLSSLVAAVQFASDNNNLVTTLSSAAHSRYLHRLTPRLTR